MPEPSKSRSAAMAKTWADTPLQKLSQNYTLDYCAVRLLLYPLDAPVNVCPTKGFLSIYLGLILRAGDRDLEKLQQSRKSAICWTLKEGMTAHKSCMGSNGNSFFPSRTSKEKGSPTNLGYFGLAHFEMSRKSLADHLIQQPIRLKSPPRVPAEDRDELSPA